MKGLRFMKEETIRNTITFLYEYLEARLKHCINNDIEDYKQEIDIVYSIINDIRLDNSVMIFEDVNDIEKEILKRKNREGYCL